MSKKDVTSLLPVFVLLLLGVLVVNFVVTNRDIPTGLLTILGAVAGSLFIAGKREG